MIESRYKQKIAKRIVKYSEIYKNDFDDLIKRDIQELLILHAKLLVDLRIKFAYKLRHSK